MNTHKVQAETLLDVIKVLNEVRPNVSHGISSKLANAICDLQIVMGLITKPQKYKCSCCSVELNTGNCAELVRPAEFVCDSCKEEGADDVYIK